MGDEQDIVLISVAGVVILRSSSKFSHPWIGVVFQDNFVSQVSGWLGKTISSKQSKGRRPTLDVI